MMNHMLDNINIAQLEILGVKNESIHLMLVIFCAIITAIIAYIFISLCIFYQWKHVMVYVSYSLGFLVIWWHPNVMIPVNITLEQALKATAIIGWCLALYLFVFKKRKGKEVKT